MFSSGIKEIQLKIYYFFMLADGECTPDELSKFESICEAMGVDADVKIETIKFCKDSIHCDRHDNSIQIIQEVTKILDADMGPLESFRSINRSKKAQAEVVWNLVNLGYADVEYSEPEKRIVKFLSTYWKMDNAVISDINDTAETILALTKQKKWVKTTNKSYDEITIHIEEIDKEIVHMANNMEILISEADIA